MDILRKIKNIKNNIPNDVTLVAVSKTKNCEDIMKVYDQGIRDFGENYVQELINKIEKLPTDIRWHMIGHLQKNKVKYIVNERIYLIHSVDSISLAKEINKYAKKRNMIMNILLEINILKEESKYGFYKEDLEAVFKEVQELKNINISGFMMMAPNTDDKNKLHSCFKKLKELSDLYSLKLLSMGMSNDYKIAIEEGSNIIRIGTAIFGPREKKK